MHVFNAYYKMTFEHAGVLGLVSDKLGGGSKFGSVTFLVMWVHPSESGLHTIPIICVVFMNIFRFNLYTQFYLIKLSKPCYPEEKCTANPLSGLRSSLLAVEECCSHFVNVTGEDIMIHYGKQVTLA